jgi:hypothetical protein
MYSRPTAGALLELAEPPAELLPRRFDRGGVARSGGVKKTSRATGRKRSAKYSRHSSSSMRTRARSAGSRGRSAGSG